MRDGELEVFLVHPGGPFWKNKDAGAWTVAKGEILDGEDPLAAARREFEEETGFESTEPFIALGSVRQKSGKVVHAWAFLAELDPSALSSNTFEAEWPPRSGRRAEFPEIDRAAWLRLSDARTKINPAQIAFLELLARAFDAANA